MAIILVILLSMTSAIQIKPIRAENTIVVPDDYSTIQAAINAAKEGDTVYIRAGTYYENIVVNKTVSLIGEDKNSTVIDGNQNDPVIKVATNNVNITRFTIQNAGFESARKGILLYHANYCNISGNAIEKSTVGFWLQYSSNNILSLNTVINNVDIGIVVSSGSSYNRMLNNTLVSSSRGILVADYNYNSNYNLISNNEIKSGTYGIQLSVVSHNIISSNILENNGHGISVDESTENYIVYNQIRDNVEGILLEGSIVNPNFTSHSNIVRGNDIVSNSNFGLVAAYSSNNSIFHNNFVQNRVQAKWFGSVPSENDWDADYPLGGNYWDDYSGVDINSGPDQDQPGNDGIGDAPYVVDSYNQDNYPLMNPYTERTPIAILTAFPTTVIEDIENVVFYASDSFDPDGYITAYWFDYGDGNNSVWTDSSTYTWTYSDGGEYYAKVKVKADDGQISEWSNQVKITVISVSNQPPKAIIDSISPNPSMGGETVTLQGHGEDLDGYIVEYRWESDKDGLLSDQPSFDISTLSVNMHTIAFKVKDNDGQWSDLAEEILTIKEPVNHTDLIQEYFPYLIFCEKEGYYPTDFYYNDTDINNNPSNYDESWPLTVYVYTVEFNSTIYPSKEFLAIEYWLYYARDDGVISFEVDGKEVGLLDHDHDWESVYVFLEKTGTDYAPAWIMYFHHANFKYPSLVPNEDGYSLNEWGNGFETKDNTHPIVHVSRDKHASLEKTSSGWGWFTLYFWGTPITLIEQCDGGRQLGYQDFDIIYVEDVDPNWPTKFGDIDAPWNRSRWSKPENLLDFPYGKEGFSMIKMSEPQNKLYLHVYDNQSRHIGIDYETNEIEFGIPGAYYVDFGGTTFITLQSNITDFKVTVDGKYADELVETYGLLISTVIDGEVVDEISLTEKTIEQGKSQDFDVKLDLSGITVEETPVGKPDDKQKNVTEDNTPLFIFAGIVAMLTVMALTIVIWKRKKEPK